VAGGGLDLSQCQQAYLSLPMVRRLCCCGDVEQAKWMSALGLPEQQQINPNHSTVVTTLTASVLGFIIGSIRVTTSMFAQSEN
jgi:hypothetical protein